MTATIAAVASIAAATISALTLVVTGRRENRKWIREQTLHELDNFVTASFEGQIIAVWEARRDGITGLAGYKRKSDQAHADKRAALTLLRLTARKKVIEAASRLMEYEKVLHEFVYDPAHDPHDDLHMKQYDSGKRLQAEMRDDLFDSARRSLWIPKGPRLKNRYPDNGVAPPPEEPRM